MELIKNNPYHIIGILAGANQREIAKQKAKINAFQKVGKAVEFETDLKFVGEPERTDISLQKAYAQIEINKDKLFHALFWFVNNNHLDDLALNYLQSGDFEKAEDIWKKTTEGKVISSKNFSAFNNLGTLELASAINKRSFDPQRFKGGISLKSKLFVSDYFNDFCHLVADETYTVDSSKELGVFVDEILKEVQKLKVADSKKIPTLLLGSIDNNVKSIVAEKLTEEPQHNIERNIEKTKRERLEDQTEGFNLAESLFRDTKRDLATLSEVLGKSDLKYQVVSDKLAKELLQCGIDYFKVYQENEELHDGDLGNDVLKLFKKAKTIATGTQTKDRISENIDGLTEWIENSEEREKQSKIRHELQFVTDKLETFQIMPDSIDFADDLVTSCKPKLQKIRSVLGSYDDFYLKISSAVVNNALGMLVAVINEAQQDRLIQMGILEGLKSKVRDALRVSEKLGGLDMLPELKRHYTTNHLTLSSIGNQIGVSSYSRTRQTSTSRASETRRSTGSTASGSSTTSPRPNTTRSSSTNDYDIADIIRIIFFIIMGIVIIRACIG